MHGFNWARSSVRAAAIVIPDEPVVSASIRGKERFVKSNFVVSLAALGSLFLVGNSALGQQPVPLSPLQTTLSQSSQASKFTFVVFHRDNGDGTRALYQQVKDETSKRIDVATMTSARVDDPGEKRLVEKFGVARAPMPMTVVVAPNGAVTGLFPRTMSQEQAATAIVPPTMMRCMKELQDQKLVFVCFTRTDRVDVPLGVQSVGQMPQFKDRITLVGMQLDDPAEARFYQQMKLDSKQVNGPYAVLIAPPGALIGHFNSQSTADQIAAALHKAGKCCDDANCKHNQPTQASGARPALR